ncbi:IPIL1 protein, partial [Rhinopomastus cyanomelas]|nr:IPIL1 protein [Rhinopomastus cyanomelas]
ILAKRIQKPMKTVAHRSCVVEELVTELLEVCRKHLSKTFFPVLEPAIGVGSAFEGWCPNEDKDAYCMLVPLKPPRGHSFHLELGTSGGMLARDSRIRVELECTCGMKYMLCFIHTDEDKLRRNQAPSLLRTLCLGSYLDVQRIAFCFQSTVESVWGEVSHSRNYRLQVLPSCWFCRMLLTSDSGSTLPVVIIFGVQQGNSDLYLSSQPVDIYDSSITWPLSFAVAEAKFFSFIARNCERDSVHLECLHVLTRILDGSGISTYTMKTVVMHLLHQSWSFLGLSGWHRRYFMELLAEILVFLYHRLEERLLEHFFLDNDKLPGEIIMLSTFERGKPANLLQHLQEDVDAHSRAMSEFKKL